MGIYPGRQKRLGDDEIGSYEGGRIFKDWFRGLGLS